MDVHEFAATMQQLVREREALNGAYTDLQQQAEAGAQQAAVSGPRPQEELVPALVELTMKLMNFVNMEREQSDKLFALLMDAGHMLAEAYDLDVPPDGPNQGGSAG